MNRRDALKALAGMSGAMLMGVDARATSPPSHPVRLPDWVPAPGHRANISLNQLADIDPERPPPHGLGPQAFHGTQGLAAIFKTWNGAIFSPDYGPYGAMIYYGGGHFGYYGTQLSLFDFSTRLWSKVNEPVVLPGAKSYRDYDYDYSGGTGSTYWLDHPEICDLKYHDMYGTTPEVQHTYDGVVYLPPASGGGRKGSMLVRARGHAAIHRCDLDTGEWSRFSEPSPYSWRGGNTASTCFDPVRKRVWIEGAGPLKPQANALEYFDIGKQRWGAAAGLNRNSYQYRCSHYWSSQDAWLSLSVTADKSGRRLGLQAIDLSEPEHGWVALKLVSESGAPISYQPDVDWPSVAGTGFDLCTANGCFYLYEGQGKSHIWRLEPAIASPFDRPWRLSKEILRGEPPVFSGQSAGNGGLVLSRWRYVRHLKSFVWADHPERPVQLWRPAGAT
jgi:hypothetical protein